jgi:4-amino-4-deoxy-L-arabinose transferase-like glycosyltransferase
MTNTENTHDRVTGGSPLMQGSSMPLNRPARTVLIAILTTFALLGAIYSVTVPIFEASDELWHYPMVEVIARTWQLPVQPLEPGTSSGPWRQEGSQPPLYYALSAALTAWIDTQDLLTVWQPNPHTRAGEVTPERDNANLVLHNAEVERFPWRGTVLAVHLVRFFSVALGVWSVYLTWALIRELYPAHEWIAVLAAAIHAFTPMHLFISSSINNDNLIIPLSTLALLLMIRSVKRAGVRLQRADLGHAVGLGCVLALALLTKASGLALIPLALAALAWATWRRPEDVAWPTRIRQVGLQTLALLTPPVILSGWWFYRNVRLYGDWLGFNAFYAVLGTRDVPADLRQLWAERTAFSAGYWGNFGGLNVPMPAPIYRALDAIAVLAAAGLAIALLKWVVGLERAYRAGDGRWQQRVWPFAWSNLTAARALAWVWPLGVLISWTQWATFTWSSQGRLIFSALPMWSAGLVIGLAAWAPRPGVRPAGNQPRAELRLALPALLGSTLLVLCIVALPAWIQPAYRPPAHTDRTREDLGLVPLNARYGEEVELLGYALESSTTRPGDRVALTLMWRALTPTPSHRSIFIHLLGEGDRIVMQRDSFPGHGRLPSTHLAPGYTWIEHHILPIPGTAYAPDVLTLAVGVYETATGSRTPLTNGAVSSRFGALTLAPRQPGSSGLNVRFGEGIVLDAYDLSTLVAAPGDEVTVTLTWIRTGAIDDDYTLSTQFIDDQWRKAAQSDAWPQEGRAPTSAWEVGARIIETRTLTIDPRTEPGAYHLRIAFYRVDEAGELAHLPVALTREGMPERSLTLTSLRVE